MLKKQLDGYRLTTARIIYHLPDHPRILQEFIWQDLDLIPQYPVLNRFLDHWETHIEGRLHSVTVAASRVILPPRFRYADVSLTVN